MMQAVRKHCANFAARLVKDFRHKELFPLKILFFVHASTLYVLYPYLSIHMRELGINVEETAIMSAVTPVIAIVMPPLAGMVADKIGNFKVLLSLFSTLGGLAALLLLLVPAGRIHVTYPDEVFFSVGCGTFNDGSSGGNELYLTLSEDYPCNQTSLLTKSETNLVSTLETCGLMCEYSASQKENSPIPERFIPHSSEEVDLELSVDSILKARSYSIEVKSSGAGEANVFFYNLTLDDMSHKQTKEESLGDRFMKNNKNFHTALRRFADNLYFFPTDDLNDLSCSRKDLESLPASNDFLLPLSEPFQRMKRESKDSKYECFFGPKSNETENLMTIDVGETVRTLTKKLDKNTFPVKSMFSEQKSIDPACDNIGDPSSYKTTVYLHDPDNEKQVVHEINMGHCEPRCLLTALRSDVCQNLNKLITYNPSLTFWIYLIIRVFIGIIGGTAFAMFEGAVIAVLREQNADYGLQRIYASIGGMISSPLSGILIDYASEGKGYTDFRPAFYLYAALKLVGGGLMLWINLEFKSGAENVVTDVIAVLKQVQVIALMIASFVLGTAWGYIESFLFWFLQDLGGTRSLMGITITVGGLAGLPLLALSGPIIQKIGHPNVIFIGFVFYAIRLLGYSLIVNPWHSLFFEAMESITTSLAFTAAVTYAAKLSTPTTDSSVQGLLGGLYFGVGKGAGSLMGGYMMNAIGTRRTFQVFAVFTLALGCIYFFFNKFYLSKLPDTGTDICKKEVKMDKVNGVTIVEEKPKIAIENGNNGLKLQTVNEEQAHDNIAFERDAETKTESSK